MKTFFKKAVPTHWLNLYYYLWPFLGALMYGFPSKDIKVIGVTGTNGKTTVTHLATGILEEAGYKVASISSLRFKIGDKEWKNELKMTMPGRMTIQKLLRQAVNSGCKYFVLEVTSEGIKQSRHKFIDFDIGVFTNLTPEHIESHGSFEKYKAAKGELFKSAKRAVINSDDENAEYFSKLCKGEKRYYSLSGKNIADNLPFLGEFNRSNALAAANAAMLLGVDTRTIQNSLAKAKGIPGRMEVVIKEPFTVVVDYAHTPDALEKVYKAIRANYKLQTTNYKLVCVLGSAGGGRDKWKRPEMGRIAAEYCDEIILTNEDPYNENPDSILDEIESGFSSTVNYQLSTTNYRRILDRRFAIQGALKSANPGDIAIITGKGAEPWIMTKDGKIPWDDREIVKEEYDKFSGT